MNKFKLASIENEIVRTNKFIRDCELVRKEAFIFKDSKFYATLAYEKALLCQAWYLQGTSKTEVIALLRQSVCDFIIGLEFGYTTESVEINNWFYRSLVVNDLSLAHFLAALPAEVWPYGEIFPRFQAYWGFAQFRRKYDEALKWIDFLLDWCFESDSDKEQSEIEKQLSLLEQNQYHIMNAITIKDEYLLIQYLHERAQLRTIIPPEGTRYERYQLLDFLTLGLCRIALLNGLDIKINEPSLPLELLFINSKA
ncbi:hypothetical protein [Methylosarcina fibrata]|uniref:hypothetical protein n=1 Tax=Methylosarcina fibrata TaxID=105972 RepID=UPI00037611AE|nr:hypothetical protein [Methylosarcina fibrata]